MRFLSAALMGAATASVIDQQPLQLPKSFPAKAKDALERQLHNMQDALKGLSAEAAAVWDEVSM